VKNALRVAFIGPSFGALSGLGIVAYRETGLSSLLLPALGGRRGAASREFVTGYYHGFRDRGHEFLAESSDHLRQEDPSRRIQSDQNFLIMIADFKFGERRASEIARQGQPLDLADRIERFGRALTAKQLATVLAVSTIVFPQSPQRLAAALAVSFRRSRSVFISWMLRATRGE
jgi:hypothetical protein